MGLDLNDLPEPMRSLVPFLTGGVYPDAEPDGLMAARAGLLVCARQVAGLRAECAGRVGSLLDGDEWQGRARDRFEAVWRGLGGEGRAAEGVEGLLDQIERAIAEEAESLREHAVRMQYARWMVWTCLIMLSITIAALMWNFAGWAALKPRVWLARLSLERLRRQILAEMARFGAISGGMDLAVQGLQMTPMGLRGPGDFDWSSIAMSTATGAAGGALFGTLGYAASRVPNAGLAAFSQGRWGQALLGERPTPGRPCRHWR